MLIYLIIGIILTIIDVYVIEREFGKSFIETWDEHVDICEEYYNKSYDDVRRDLNDEGAKKTFMVISILVMVLVWPIMIINVLKYISRGI